MFGLSATAALAVGVGGGMVLSSLGKDAPDTSGQERIAGRQVNLSEEELAFAKSIYNDAAPDRAAARARAAEVSDVQLAGARKQIAMADDYDQYSKGTFRPVDRAIVADAMQAGSEAEQDKAAGRSIADVTQAAAGAREQGTRAMSRMGVNPADGRFGAMQTGVQNAETLAAADAGTKARERVLTLASAKRADAANMGRGLASSQATAAGLALNQGNSSVANANAVLAPGLNAQAAMGTAYSGARQGFGQAANIYGDISRQQAAASDDSAMYGALGNVAGKAAAAYFMSDKNEKTGRKPVKGQVALAAARKMPVQSWRYRKDSLANDGGKTHIGPMAQDVNAAAGEAAAPGGKKIDLVSMNGITLAAVKALDKKVTTLAKRRA